MKTRIILQSRLSSLRLPGKALMVLGQLPAVVLCAKRAQTSGHEIYVATSLNPEDDMIAAELARHQLPFVRGSLSNIVERFCLATADLNNDDIVIRLTADNLLPEDQFINAAIERFISSKHDFLTSTFPKSPLPYGMSVELFRVDFLRRAQRANLTAYDQEHLTSWIARQAEHISYFTPEWPEHLNLHHVRVTLDTFEDYIRLSRAFNQFADPVSASWRDVLDAIMSNEPSEVSFPREKPLILGTAQLGMRYGKANTTGLPTESDALHIVNQALSLGIKAIDTANAYGDAENRIGKALAQGKQAQVEVITKLSPLNHLTPESSETEIEMSVLTSVFQSCHRLKQSTLDVLMLHRWHHYYAFKGKIWQTLLRLKQEGLIRKLGASVTTPHDAIEALEEAEISHIQLPFNVVDCRWLDENLQAAISKRNDIQIFVRSVLLQGILANEKEFWPSISELDVEEVITQLNHFVRIFQRINKADLCYAYVRSFDWVSGVVVGIENSAQLFDNLHLFNQSCLSYEQRIQIQNAFNKMPLSLIDPARWS